MASDFTLSAVIDANYERFVSGMNSVAEAATAGFDRVRSAFTTGAEQSNAKMNELTTKTEESSHRIGEQFTEMRESIMHLVEAFALIEGIHWAKESIAEGLELGERLKNLATETGMSVQHVQTLDFAAQATGASVDRLASIVTRLSKAATGGGQGATALEYSGLRQSDFDNAYGGLEKPGNKLREMGPLSAAARAELSQLISPRQLNLLPAIENLRSSPRSFAIWALCSPTKWSPSSITPRRPLILSALCGNRTRESSRAR
jgi:hypothetical protein